MKSTIFINSKKCQLKPKGLKHVADGNLEHTKNRYRIIICVATKPNY